jgi:phosphoribosylglycinamide formyltransferase-1
VSRAVLAVCCSGYGTNRQAILGAIRTGRLKARVGVVISDNPSAYALKRALDAKVPAIVIDPRRFSSRQGFDRELARVTSRFKARLIVLAGFMRILSPGFVRRYRGRILNIHPALLPAFPGCHGVRDALRHGVKVTGVTVHFVDEKLDHGPILLQAPVAVRKRDTEETLLARVHKVEHWLYPKAIQMALDGKVRGPIAHSRG